MIYFVNQFAGVRMTEVPGQNDRRSAALEAFHNNKKKKIK
jgi:hypothetical protein